jgi:hypothetical protein
MSWQQWVVFLLYGAGMILVAYAITTSLLKPAPQPEWAREWQHSRVAWIANGLVAVGGMIIVDMYIKGALP